jgi:hypothetical protein
VGATVTAKSLRTGEILTVKTNREMFRPDVPSGKRPAVASFYPYGYRSFRSVSQPLAPRFKPDQNTFSSQARTLPFAPKFQFWFLARLIFSQKAGADEPCGISPRPGLIL